MHLSCERHRQCSQTFWSLKDNLQNARARIWADEKSIKQNLKTAESGQFVRRKEDDRIGQITSVLWELGIAAICWDNG